MSVELLRIRRTRAKQACWVTELLAVALVLIGALVTSAHAAAEYPEDAVKAVFLYRFAGYVTWPEPAASAPQFTIAVLGADDVAEQLRTYLPEHPIQGKPAHVATIQGLSQLGDAEMLYVGPGFPGKLSVLIDSLKGRPILIVTDRPGALDEGSIVNFLIERQHVRFEISTSAAKRSSLLIGSGLLAVAERVETGDLRRRSVCRPFTESDTPCPQQSAALIYPLGQRKGD